MNHIVNMCPLTKYQGGLNLFHGADDDAVMYLDLQRLQHSRNKQAVLDGVRCIYLLEYDTRCHLTCAQKLTRVSLIYRTEPTTKKWKTEKLKSKKADMLRSIGKQSGESVESLLKEEKEGK